MKNGLMRVLLGVLLAVLLVGGVIFVSKLKNGRVRGTSSFSREDYERGGEYITSTDIDEASKKATYTVSKNNIESISVVVKAAKVVLKEGSDFSVAIQNIDAEDFDTSVRNGIWNIEVDNSDRINIKYGFNFGDDDEYTNEEKVIITIPSGFDAKKVSVDIEAGEFDADRLAADKILVDVGAGAAYIDELEAVKGAELIVGAGEIVVDDIDIEDGLNVDCGMGNIELNGNINGNSKIECGMGNITIKLAGKKQDYNYSVDCGMGNITIGNTDYSGISHNEVITNNSDSSEMFALKCGMGNLELKFSK